MQGGKISGHECALYLSHEQLPTVIVVDAMKRIHWATVNGALLDGSGLRFRTDVTNRRGSNSEHSCCINAKG